jgi:hypothetical protein
MAIGVRGAHPFANWGVDMGLPLTLERLERLYAMQDEAEAAGDTATADGIQAQWEGALDASGEAVLSGRAEIVEALALAAFLASADVRKFVDHCTRLARAGVGDVRLLVALRLAIGACADDVDASHVRPIVENVLRAMTTLRIV